MIGRRSSRELQKIGVLLMKLETDKVIWVPIGGTGQIEKGMRQIEIRHVFWKDYDEKMNTLCYANRRTLITKTKIS